MKPLHPFLVLALIGWSIGLPAQELPAAGTSTVRILGEIPDGTPQPAAPETPRLRIASRDVLSTKVVRSGSRKITIQKVAPILLPPLPEAPAPVADEARPLPSAPWVKPHATVSLGVTVFENREHPAETYSLIHCWPAPGKESFTVAARADFLLLTSTFAEYETDECRYSLMMMVSPGGRGETDKPHFEDSEKTPLIVTEGHPGTADLAPLTALLELYDANRPQLETAWLARQQAAAAAAIERAKNPPENRPITLKYWRVDAAGQAGVTPQAPVIR